MNNMITILFVDDEPINLMLFKLNFKSKYNILTAESGFKGLNELRAHPETSIVISDMRMPGMNGIDFIKIAKKEFSNISYFILTGYDITDEIASALEEKLIHKYFRKPFNMKEIDESFNEVIQNI